MSEKATLQDILNYEPKQYLTDKEISLIRNTFKGNEALIHVIRKIMIPTMADPELPIEEMASDVYFANTQWSQIPADEAKILVTARQEALQFIIGGLIKLKVISNIKEETPEEIKARQKKDSVK